MDRAQPRRTAVRAPTASARVRAAALAVASAWASACGGGAEPAPSDPPAERGVAYVRIEGQLDVGHLGQLKRALDTARERDLDRLVVALDTPGGAVELMWQIGQALREVSEGGVVPVAWVDDRALSAGVLVALSCERVYVTPTASLGASLPVQPGPAGIEALPEEGGVREKVTSALRAEFRAAAEARHRPAALAEGMIDPRIGVYVIREDGEQRIVNGREWEDLRALPDAPELVRTIARPGELVTLSGGEAVELGFADGVAASFEELLEKIGKSGTAVAGIERRRSDDWLVWLDALMPVLIAAGLVLAYTEIKTPGFGVPGVLAVACFALVLAGRWLAGLADVPHVVAVALGVALIALEVFVMPGTLWAGILGGVLVLGGLVAASVGPGLGVGSALERDLLIDAAFHTALAASAAVVGALILSRFLPKTPVLRGLVLDPGAPQFGGGLPESADARLVPGAVGRARSDLRPVGKVALDATGDAEWEARAAGTLIPRGSRVRVVEVEAGRLVVEREAEERA